MYLMPQLQPALIIGTLINGWCINCSVLGVTNICDSRMFICESYIDNDNPFTENRE